MSQPPIYSTNFSRASLATFSTRFGQLGWENLTGTLASRHSTLFKILGLAAIFGLLVVTWWVYNSRTVNKPNQKSPLSSSTIDISKPETPALPNGINQAQVDEIINIFTRNFKYCQAPQALKMEGRSSTTPIIWLGDLQEICKGQEPEFGEARVLFNRLCTYLQEQKIIASCTPMRCSQWQLILHKDFIQKLESSN
jgi:hypothetical protein